jgi:hypothetical protein
MPLMLAFLPIFVLPMLEAMMGDTRMFRDAFFLRTVTPPIFDGGGIAELIKGGNFYQAAETVDIMGSINFIRFMSSPSLWSGLVVCGLLVAATIYVRRYRDDS